MTIFNTQSINTGGLSYTADSTGNLILQSDGNIGLYLSNSISGLGVTITKNLTVGGAVAINGSLSVTGNLTFSDSSIQTAAASPYVLKNRIINGGFQIWQRGTSTTVSGTGTNDAYLADRWITENSSTSATLTATQTADSTNAYGGGQYYMSMTIPTFASGGHIDQYQKIEAANIFDLANKTVTLSFWASATTTGGTFALNIYTGYPSATDNWTSATYTQITGFSPASLTSSPQKFTVTFTLPSGCTAGSVIYIRLINNGSSTSSATTFNVGGVQLEAGSTATPFERRLYNQELANCQRYYYKLTNTAGSGYALVGIGRTINSTYGDVLSISPTPMRTVPTINYSAVGHFQSAYGTATTISIESGNYSYNSINIALYVAPGATVNSIQILQFNNTSPSTAFIDFSAEL
jgi:hypothetical protein